MKTMHGIPNVEQRLIELMAPIDITPESVNALSEVRMGKLETFDRTTINACEDEEFVYAVRSTGCKKLIIAALWTEALTGRA